MTISIQLQDDEGRPFHVAVSVVELNVSTVGERLPRHVLPTPARFEVTVESFAHGLRLVQALNPHITAADLRRLIMSHTHELGDAMLQ